MGSNDYILRTHDGTKLQTVPFNKSFKIESLPKEQSAFEIAPEINNSAIEEERFVEPYTKKMQIPNLKKRWNSIGSTNGEDMFRSKDKKNKRKNSSGKEEDRK